MSELYHTAQIRNLSGSDIIKEYAATTAQVFSRTQEGTPLIIPCFNEQDDLPGTLLSASRSRLSLLPVVIDNGSSDHTAEIAKDMGAHVLELVEPNKIKATLAGLAYAVGQLEKDQVVCTDGDTLVPPRWAETLVQDLRSLAQPGEGAMVCGPLLFAGGTARLVNVIRSAKALYNMRVANCLSKLPPFLGANYGLRLDQGGAMLRNLQDRLDPGVFLGDDSLMRDSLLMAGVPLRGNASLAAAVITQGDRGGSLSDVLRPKVKRDSAYENSYNAQYPDRRRYKSPYIRMSDIPRL